LDYDPTMTRKVVISANETHLWEKLDEIREIDPSISGGIDQIVLGHRVLSRRTPIPILFSAGYEEVHQIEPGFCAHITDAFLERDWRLTATSRDTTLRFRIAFAGEAGYVARDNTVSDEAARCSFIIRPPGDSLTAQFRSNTAYRYCSLSLNQEYLRTTLGLRGDEMPPALLSHWERKETVMGHFPASKAALAEAARFFSIKGTGTWRDLAVRSISFDLLRLLFHDWQNARPRTKSSIRITPLERHRLDRIRDQIERDPAAPITLTALCEKAKINRNKLHFGFKQQFGASIHDYQTELRMRIAFKLLESTTLSIGEIAERTGHSEPTNFTAAFKKYFAVLPRDVRQLKEEA
jgi:AraC-like DNA-binding protein